MSFPALALLLGSIVSLPLAGPAVDGLPGPAAFRGTAVEIDQCFIEEGSSRAGSGARFLLSGPEVAVSLEPGRIAWLVRGATERACLVEQRPLGALDGVEPCGLAGLPGVIHRFRGEPEAWRTGLSTWRAVGYTGLWAGIDLVIEAEGQALKSTYVVAPGAAPADIAWEHRGAERVRVDEAGRLVIEAGAGALVDAAPVAWQELDGERREVAVEFTVAEGEAGTFVVGYAVADHDPTSTLWIDPAVIVQTGFLGGTARDEAASVCLDAAGNIYVGGWARSDEGSFPATVGPVTTYTPTFSPWGDAFVAKLDPTGTTLVYAGYIGGSEFDFVNAIAVDTVGRAVVAGHTRSAEGDGFPVIGGPDTTHNDGIDGWVARVSADGTSLEYCGYIGGEGGEDRIFDVDVDASGRAYVVGRASSDEDSFPVTTGPDLFLDGASDAFVARVASDGLSLEYCGYVGGAATEDALAVVCDDAGRAWVAGTTYSDESSFPVAVGPGLVANGSADAFVACVEASGAALSWCGYLGGSAAELVSGMDVDSAGDVYLAGTTQSLDFPVLVGPGLAPHGSLDAFVAKVQGDGTAVLYAGVIAGSGTDLVGDVALDGEGGLWIAGTTDSAESAAVPFPVTGDLDPTYNGSGDGYVARVAPSGASLDLCGYVGGSATDSLEGIAVGPASGTPGLIDAWAVGTTLSTETSLPAVSGLDTSHNGQEDALVAHVRRTPPNPWSDEGCALAGGSGSPRLFGSGWLSAGSFNEVNLFSAAPEALAGFFLAFSSTPVPFKGGTLKPFPFLPPVFVVTSTSGSIPLGFVMPPGVPSDTELWVQWAIQDAAAIFGVSLSNALLGVTP